MVKWGKTGEGAADMPMRYCMECGAELELRAHHEGGEVPWCPACGRFRHPVFSTAVIMLVMDRARERVILIQQYGRAKNILVAGYIDQGESAEDAARREVREELGLTAAEVHYNRSEYLPRTNTLMLNFTVLVEEGEVRPNEEIDAWRWFTREDARREGVESVLFGSRSSLFFDEGLVKSFWRSFLDGNDDVWQILYAIYVFLIWHRECYSEGLE